MYPGVYAEIWMAAVFTLAGVVGTCYYVASTRGPKERAYALKVAAACWLIAVVLLSAIRLVRRPFGFLIWIPFAGGVLPFLYRCQARKMRIREAEGKPRPPDA